MTNHLDQVIRFPVNKSADQGPYPLAFIIPARRMKDAGGNGGRDEGGRDMLEDLSSLLNRLGYATVRASHNEIFEL